MSARPLLGTLVLYLYAHDALRQRNKGVYDNLQFFIRNGIAPASHESAREAFSLLLSGSSPFAIDLPPSPKVRLHSVAKIKSRLQLSQIKAFLDEPERFPGCATDRPEPQGSCTWICDWKNFDRWTSERRLELKSDCE